MDLDRRRLLLAGGSLLASCRVGGVPRGDDDLEALFAAHARALPENGGGANHYPMAAEVLEALARADAAPVAWGRGARSYGVPPPATQPIEPGAEPFGRPERFADWRQHYGALLAAVGWRAVVREQVPRLVDGIAAAGCHGLIRTAHAVRSLARCDSPARRHELATALAYWAAHHAGLASSTAVPWRPVDLREVLLDAARGTAADAADVPFAVVTARLQAARCPPVAEVAAGEAEAVLCTAVRTAAVGLHGMLEQERHRIWILHGVTTPAAAALLLPHLAATDRGRLAAAAVQATVAWFAAFGAPFARELPSDAPAPPWSELLAAAVQGGSVHTLKLLEALHRCDAGGDPIARAVAWRWLQWR